MAASTSTPAGRRSWQGGGGDTYQTSKGAWRWLLTALVLLLVALAIYLVITNWSPSRTLLVYLDSDRRERATIPLVPYLAADQDAVVSQWAHPAGMYAVRRPLDKVASWQALLEDLNGAAGVFQNAGQQPASLSDRDTLVIYVRAHGAVADLGEDGRPELRPVLIKSLSEGELAGDWTKSQMLDVGTLLAHVAQTHSELKTIVVLDVVHLVYDPRLGVLGNSFAEQVQRCWPEGADNLWAIVTTSGDELATVAPGDGRSTFNVCLLEALRDNAQRSGPVDAASLVEEVTGRLAQLPRQAGLDWVQHPVLLPRKNDRASAPPLLPRIAAAADTQATAKEAPPADKTPAKASEATKSAHRRRLSPSRTLLAMALQDAGAKSAVKTDGQETPPTKTEPAKEVSAATPPSTPAPAAPPTATAPTAAPTTAPPPAATVAPAAPEKPPTQRDLVELDLLAAWDARDRLDQLAERNQWSPALVAAPRWRRVEALLISFEERFLHDEIDDLDRKELGALRTSLTQLLARFEGQAAGDIADVDAGAIAAALDRIETGQNAAAKATADSYGKSQSNPLVEANAALRRYAQIAFRLSDYSRLHGALATAGAGGAPPEAFIDSLLGRLAQFRAAVGSNAGVALTPQTLGSLEAELSQVLAARQQLDDQIDETVRTIAGSSTRPEPGVMLRVRLLLASPLLRGGQRKQLYPLVAALPPPADKPPAIPTAISTAANPGATWNASASLADHLPLVRRTVSFLAGESAASGPLFSQLDAALAKFPGDQMPPAALGRRLRQFHEQLPDFLRKEFTLRCEGPETPQAIDLWNLYHLSLLVDGRDAQRAAVAGITLGLAQPHLPVDIANEIVRFEFDRPRQELLASEMSSGSEIQLNVVLGSEEDSNLPLVLDFDFVPGDVKLRWADTDEEIKRGKVTRMLPAKTAALAIKVAAARIPEPNEPTQTKLTVRGEFQGSKEDDTLELSLPRPHEVEVILAADAGAGAIDQDRTVIAGPGNHAPMVKLFPNRPTSFRLDVHNLASDQMEVRVFLLAPPRSADRAPGHNLGIERKLPDGMESFVQILLKEPLTSPRFQQYVVAQSDAKQPPVALAAGATAPIPLIANRPAGAAADVPLFDLAGGLVCLVASEAPVRGQRFVRWLDLDPYDPDELFEAENFTYRNRRLSFDLRIKDPRLAAGWDLLSKPIAVEWDRTADGQSKVTAELADPRTPAKFSGPVAAGQGDHIIQLHVDGYPRALIYDVRIDADGGTVAARDVKKDELDAVHIAGVSLTANDRPRAAYQFRAAEPLLPQRMDRAPSPPAAAAAPDAGGEAKPPPRPVVLTRGKDPALAAFRITKDDEALWLLVDLQADVPSSVFAGGGSIRLALEEQSARTLYRDRNVQFSLAGVEGPTLKFLAKVSDYEQLAFDPGVDPAGEPIVDVAANLVASVVSPRPSASLSDLAGHRIRVVLDGNPPEVAIENVQPSVVRSLKQKVTFRVSTDDGDGSGVESLRVRFGADVNNNDELDGMEGTEPKGIKVLPTADGRFAVEFPLSPELKNGANLIGIEAVDRAGLVGRSGQTLRVDVLGSIPDNPTLPKVKGKKKDDEKTEKG